MSLLRRVATLELSDMSHDYTDWVKAEKKEKLPISDTMLNLYLNSALQANHNGGKRRQVGQILTSDCAKYLIIDFRDTKLYGQIDNVHRIFI